jgi:hypothetical protein
MREATNKQEPSSKEGGKMKVGDQVWIKAKVIDIEGYAVRVQGYLGEQSFWSTKRDCKPVETKAVAKVEPSDPVNPSHCKQGGIEDLKKARWYLDRLIREEESK